MPGVFPAQVRFFPAEPDTPRLLSLTGVSGTELAVFPAFPVHTPPPPPALTTMTTPTAWLPPIPGLHRRDPEHRYWLGEIEFPVNVQRILNSSNSKGGPAWSHWVEVEEEEHE